MSSSTSSSRPQPTPRMTDSTSGPNGPNSLAFASLSVQSYHLDSPPFTGHGSIAAAGGAGANGKDQGPLAREGERLAQIERNQKKGTSPLSNPVKVEGMSSLLPEQNQPEGGDQEEGLSGQDSGNGNENQDASQSQMNTSTSTDKDVPKWELDSNSNSIPISQSSSMDSTMTSKAPIATGSVSRGQPPFTGSGSGSGESSGIATPISTFNKSSNRNSSSLPLAYKGETHSSMESNSHSGATSPPPPHSNSNSIQNQQSPTSNSSETEFRRNTTNTNNRNREDSTSRPSFTQLTSQDSSSEHEGDEELTDGTNGNGNGRSGNQIDEEVDGDDTAFVIGGSGGGGASGNVGGRGVPVQGSTKVSG